MLVKKIFLLLLLSFSLAGPAGAEDASFKPVEFTPQVPIQIPGQASYDFNQFSKDGTIAPIGHFIAYIMKYMIGAAGILGTIMLMVGGFRYAISQGDGQAVTSAQNIIQSSLVGIVLAATSYLILATVNTDLVNFKATGVGSIKKTTANITNITDCKTTCGDKKIIFNAAETGKPASCSCLETSQIGGCALDKNGFICKIYNSGDSFSTMIGSCDSNIDCNSYLNKITCCQSGLVVKKCLHVAGVLNQYECDEILYGSSPFVGSLCTESGLCSANINE
jgi:hypothetical protein